MTGQLWPWNRTGAGEGSGVSYRTFVDSAGKRWEVWLVTPAAAERRRIDRRKAGGGAGDFAAFSDRRKTPERRRNPFHRSVEVASEYSSGWLCFESEGDKRRLAPVPDGWYEAGPAMLATWLANAKRVVKCAP
ncbi:MAG TPA: hypothetical protein VK544_05035 [Gemmatimonadaceae bacterium]|nr:hypothetical protein [Gemmatimonadaceae bacterium]